MEINLNGHKVLVTGATGALGRAMVRTLAGCGADLIVHYRTNKELAEALAREVRNSGRLAMTIQADVTDQNAVVSMRDKIAADFGPPDIVVVSAVVQYNHIPILEQGVDDYVSQFQTCMLQPILMAKAFVPSMIERSWGRIIGINTEAAVRCGERHSAYAAAKRGMDGILRVLAREVGRHGITVNQVAPGWMITEKFPGDGNDAQKAYTEGTALKRRAGAQEVANVAAFLASDLAAYITGEFINVSGGSVMPSN
jgi:3-oxoacyl-[acyl-carrier protein] reductase